MLAFRLFLLSAMQSMSTKRKSEPNMFGPNKRGPKKKENDSEEIVKHCSSGDKKYNEINIMSRELESAEKLPEDVLKTFVRDGGKMIIAGMVTWDLTGKRDKKNVLKVRPNLYSFHRFTDDTVALLIYC